MFQFNWVNLWLRWSKQEHSCGSSKARSRSARQNTPRLSPALQVWTTWHQRKIFLHWTATLSLLYNIGKEMADHTRLKNLCSGLFKVYFSYTVMQQLVSRSETHIKTMNCSKKLISRESGLFVFVDNSFQTCENGVFCFLKVGCSNLKFTW